MGATHGMLAPWNVAVLHSRLSKNLDDVCEAGNSDVLAGTLSGDEYHSSYAGLYYHGAISAACRGGDADTVCTVLSHFGGTNGENSKAKATVCRHGNPAEDARLQKDGRGVLRNPTAPLRWACTYGHMHIVWRLADSYGLTREKIVESGALACACSGANFRDVKRLVSRFELTPGDARASEVLRKSCARGHLKLSQWLTARFGLTRDDATCGKNAALRAACAGGHRDVAQWLAEHFELTEADARALRSEALRVACVRGHLSVAQWLVDRFELATADAQSMGNYALQGACANGHADVVRWLLLRFPRTTCIDTRSSYEVHDPEIKQLLDEHYAGRR